MDTKQKKTAVDPRKRRPAPASAKSAQNPGKQRTKIEERSPRKRPVAARQQERRRQPSVQQPRQPAPEQVAPQNPVTTVNAEEQVFHPDQQRRSGNRRPRTAAERKRVEQRKKSARRTMERKKEAEKAKKRPAVVYTQPKPLNWNRLLLQIVIILAVVLAFTMGLSVFFKVEKVVVYGNHAYTAWTVQEASGIENGEQLLSINNARASGKIKTALPYVEKVRIGIKLPDTVNIYVEEYDVAYAIADQDDNWWLMTSDGRVTEKIALGTISSYTRVLGVQLDTPAEGGQGHAYEVAQQVVQSTDPAAASEQTTPVTVTGANRLDTALAILQSLELNGIVGEVASVDVSSLSNIELWYGQRFQVKVGDTNDLNKKLSWMKNTINQLNDYEMGILDVSFTTWADQVGYTPLE